MRTIYQTDGSQAGFFTAVFDGYADEESHITSEQAFQTALGDKFLRVFPDEEKAARVERKLKKIDFALLREIDYILRTPYSDREQTAFLYLRQAVAQNAPVRGMLALPEVRKAMDYAKRVGSEAERLRGFLRFHETADGLFYAATSPDNDVVDLLAPHFFARFKKTPFVLHDVKREKACLSDGRTTLVTKASDAQILFSENEERFLALWSKYYQTIYIPARKNERQMKNYMPVRYWRFMPEKLNEERQNLLDEK